MVAGDDECWSGIEVLELENIQECLAFNIFMIQVVILLLFNWMWGPWRIHVVHEIFHLMKTKYILY